MFSTRQRLGFQYQPQRDNRIRDKVKTNFNEYHSVAEDFYIKNEQQIDMGGEGIIDLAKKGYEKAKQGIKAIPKLVGKASDLYESEMGTNIINAIPSSDDTARPKFAGEKHAILQLPNGKYGIANYMGPGTQVVKRIARGDPPRTLADKVAQRHDIDYSLASAMSSKEKQLKAVREADNRMINSLNRLEQGNLDAQKNIMLGKQIIKGKTIAEDLGILDKSKFAGDLEKMSDADRMKLMAKRASLSQEGYGLPGQKLKQKLIKHYASKGSGVSLPGKGGGVSLAGQRGGFIFALLGGLIALIVEATSTVTVASIGAAAATGAASAAGGIIAKKVLGGAVSPEDVAKKVAQKVKATHQKVVDVAKKVVVKVDELPKTIVEKAKEMLSKFDNPSEVPKEKLVSISKQLIPSVKKIVQDKIKSKMAGSGVSLPGQRGGEDMNAKILAKVKKQL